MVAFLRTIFFKNNWSINYRIFLFETTEYRLSANVC